MSLTYTPKSARDWLIDLSCDDANELRGVATEDADPDSAASLARDIAQHERIARTAKQIDPLVLAYFTDALDRIGDGAIPLRAAIDLAEPYPNAEAFCRKFIALAPVWEQLVRLETLGRRLDRLVDACWRGEIDARQFLVAVRDGWGDMGAKGAEALLAATSALDTALDFFEAGARASEKVTVHHRVGKAA
jgi:hypothetical protein